MERVRNAAHQAQLAAVIEDQPDKYNTTIGERGVRLSGGQRQRIAIARALYKGALVLVFDEATSALDHGTEDAVMSALNALGPDLTVIMIAHRLTTLRDCDLVIRLDRGRVAEAGSYDEVVRPGSTPSAELV